MEFVVRISRNGLPRRWLTDAGPVEDAGTARRFPTIVEAVMATRAWWSRWDVPPERQHCHVERAP